MGVILPYICVLFSYSNTSPSAILHHIYSSGSSLPQPVVPDSPVLQLYSPIADIIWKPPEVEDPRLIPLSGLQSSTAKLSVDFPRWVKGHKPQLPLKENAAYNAQGFPHLLHPSGLSLPSYEDRILMLCTLEPTEVVDTDLRLLHAGCSTPLVGSLKSAPGGLRAIRV